MDNFDFILSCFNQFCFQEAKNNIEELEYYLATNPVTQGNQIIDEFVYAIKNYSFETIDLPLFQSICAKTGKTEMETKEIIDKVIQWKSYGKDKIAPTKQFLREIIANSIIQRGNRLHPNSPSEFLKYCKNTDFKTTEDDLMVTARLGEVDINSIIAEDEGTIIPSYFPFINNAYSDGGYHLGELIIFSSTPGSGKSLWALTECMNIAAMPPLPGRDRKLKVGMFLLGDLSVKDQIIRAAAIFSGLPFREAKENLPGIFKSMTNSFGDNFTIITAPAGDLSIDEVIETAKEKDFDVVAIDYDSNLKSSVSGSGGDNSMYAEFGDIYCKITRLTAMNKLVFVLSQPKTNVWDNELINMVSIGESSRKQHTADTIITRGLYTDCPNNVGIMNVAKCRRGEPNTRSYSIRLNNGRFITDLPKSLYDELKQQREKIIYTEADINRMKSEAIARDHGVQKEFGTGFAEAVAEASKSYERYNRMPQGPVEQDPRRGPNPFKK